MLYNKKLAITCFLVTAFVLWCFLQSAGAEGQPGEYLKYQEPQPSTSMATSWLSTIAYIFSLIVTFIVVIGLAYFASRILGQKMGALSTAGDNKVLRTMPLGPNRALYIVEVAGKYLVLGVTDHMITLLQEISDAEAIEKLKHPEPSSSPDTFQKHLAALQQLSQKFPKAFDNFKQSQQDIDREKR